MINEKELQEEAIKLAKEAVDFVNNVNNGRNLDAIVNMLKTNMESLKYNDQEKNYIIMYAFAYIFSYSYGGNNVSI